MNVEIRKLKPEDAQAYVNFFDTTLHDDHNPDNTCYCVNWCSADHRTLERPDREQRRKMALEYVQNGIIKGYVAWADNKVIGWCNANTKADCLNCAGILYAIQEMQRAVSSAEEKVKAIYCFMIAEEYHRQGIARKLLQAVCSDAKEEGYDYVEAYPHKDASNKLDQFMGFDKLYLRVKSSLPKSIYLSEPLARFFQINFKKQLTQKPKCAAALVTDSIKR